MMAGVLDGEVAGMRIEYGSGEVVEVEAAPTLDEARKLIAEGAINATELFLAAGLSADEARREVGSLPVNWGDIQVIDEDGKPIIDVDPYGPRPR